MKAIPTLLFLLALALGACTAGSSTGQQLANGVGDPEVMGKWARSCALCHVDGVADAQTVRGRGRDLQSVPDPADVDDCDLPGESFQGPRDVFVHGSINRSPGSDPAPSASA